MKTVTSMVGNLLHNHANHRFTSAKTGRAGFTTPADWDLIATPDEAETWAKQSGGNAYPDGRGKKQVVRGLAQPVEFELAWPGSTAEELLSMVVDETCLNLRRNKHGYTL